MKKRDYVAFFVFAFLSLSLLFVFDASADLIIDNGNPGTSYTGAWPSSKGTTPYGADSLWAKDNATYTWKFTPTQTGTQNISMWWSYTAGRSSSIPVDIQHAGGTARVVINQKLNSGKWNLLGTYSFTAGTTYSVKITAQASPTTTCADAVKISAVVTTADLIIDNGKPGTSFTGTWPVSGGTTPYGADSLWAKDNATYTWKFTPTQTGTQNISMWWSYTAGRSSSIPVDIQHAGGTARVVINQKLNSGKWNLLGTYSFTAGTTYSVKITAQASPTTTCADAVKISASAPTSPPTSPPTSQTTEHIYVAAGYATLNAMPLIVSTLQDMGATLSNGVWSYTNTAKKKFIIHPVTTNQGFMDALKTEGAHIMYFGHSNYGLGQVFATNSEIGSHAVNNIFDIDDDRILNNSSPWIALDLHYLRTTQAYPHLWPTFKDGTSAVMPYVFGDPRGNPAYNYYVTYQVPGDPTYYKIVYTLNGIDTAIQRFSGSGKPAWYSSTGATPNPSNSSQTQYFITNTASWSPSFQATGSWNESKGVSGYYKENYLDTPAGQGNDQARWFFSIPKSGNYDVSAWWSASSSRTSNAPYTIISASGNTTVRADQRSNGRKWNKLGTFNFGAGKYSVLLTDNAASGSVVADAIKVSGPGNPPDIIQVNFSADVRYGRAPRTVNFTAHETGDVSSWTWNFGDGDSEYRKDGGETIQHIYEKPGTYTVTLTGTGSLGSSTRTRTGYIIIGPTTPPLQAEFRPPSSRTGQAPFTAVFTDMSTGNIASRLWNFGDGSTSTSKSPSHTYSVPGNYTVKLTVTDSGGKTSTETKENIIRAVVFEKIIDNVDYPKTHYSNRIIVFRKDLEVPKDQMKYARMLYVGCDSGHYYTDTFNRGILFFATKSSGLGEIAMSEYLKAYTSGKSDYQIWQIIQGVEPLYDYYDFTKKPSQQQ